MFVFGLFVAGQVMAEATAEPTAEPVATAPSAAPAAEPTAEPTIKCTKEGKQIEVKNEQDCKDQGGTIGE